MRSIGKLLYTHNPFYLLSAGFVFVGLHLAFKDMGNPPTHTWNLASCFAGYTILLVLTSVLIVRLGQVRDDARTIALLVVLMFVAISSSFDHACVTQTETATWILGGGFIFSVLLTQLMLFGLRIRLPVAYLLPYYLLLALFFLFPMMARQSWWMTMGISDRWRTMLFPAAAGILTLTLIPAIHRGRVLMQRNGSPWSWPMYPWSIFFFLAVGVCGRTYVLSLSFQEDYGSGSTFGAYYLVPFFACVIILFVEIAIVERLRYLQTMLTIVPALLVVMALPWRDTPLFLDHYHDVVTSIGSPVPLALILAGGLLCYMWIRGIAAAEWSVMVALCAMACIDRNDTTIAIREIVNPLPLIAVGVFQLMISVHRRSSLRFFAGAAAAMLAGSSYLDDLPRSVIVVVFAHGMLLSSLMVALLYRDRLARLLSQVNPIIICGFVLVAIVMGTLPANSLTTSVLYGWVVSLLMALVWLSCKKPVWKAGMSLSTAMSMGATLNEFPIWIAGNLISTAAQQLLGLGAVCFALGLLISGFKGGAGNRMMRWLYREWILALIDWRKQFRKI